MKMLIATLMLGGIVTAAPEKPAMPQPGPGCEHPTMHPISFPTDVKKEHPRHKKHARPHRHQKPDMKCPRCGEKHKSGIQPRTCINPQRDFEWRVDRQRRVHPVIHRHG